jgi:hypothetical protein
MKELNMDHLVDIFSGDNFSVRSLTDAINIVPNMYGRVNQLGIFQEKAIDTTLVSVEFNHGVLNLIPKSDRGTPAPKNRTAKRSAKHFEVPRIALDDVILPSDIQNVRAFGSMNMKTPESVTNDKLLELSNKHDITNEFLKCGALNGLVVDASGATILDIFTEFSVTQLVQAIDFDDAAETVRAKFNAIKRHIKLALLGDTMSYVHALCSPGYFDALIQSEEAKAAYTNYMNAQAVGLGMAAASANPLRDDVRDGFMWQGIFFEEYLGTATDIAGTAHNFIPDNTARYFPVGTNNTFREWHAPADWMETVNTMGLKKYAKVVPEDGNRHVELLSQSNPLPICLRPDVLVQGSLA